MVDGRGNLTAAEYDECMSKRQSNEVSMAECRKENSLFCAKSSLA